jgi:hypothetical protein
MAGRIETNQLIAEFGVLSAEFSASACLYYNTRNRPVYDFTRLKPGVNEIAAGSGGVNGI